MSAELAATALPSRRSPGSGWSWTIIISVLVHVSLVGLVLWGGSKPREHRPTSVAVVQSKPKPKPEEKHEDEKPKPPPPPPVVRQKVAEVAPVVAPPPVAAPAPAAPAHVATGLTMSNSGGSGGIAVGGMSNTPQPRAAAAAPPSDDKQSRTPPAPAKTDECEGPDTKPKPSGTMQVDYPDKARADGIEGRIQVRIRVGDDGAVVDVEVVEGIDPSLDAVVLAVLRTWKFHPATHCGKPVAGVLAWAQRFELGD